MHKLFRIIILLGGILTLAAQAPLAQQSSPTPAVQVEAQLLEQGVEATGPASAKSRATFPLLKVGRE